jgi:hypothetical protein
MARTSPCSEYSGIATGTTSVVPARIGSSPNGPACPLARRDDQDREAPARQTGAPGLGPEERRRLAEQRPAGRGRVAVGAEVVVAPGPQVERRDGTLPALAGRWSGRAGSRATRRRSRSRSAPGVPTIQRPAPIAWGVPPHHPPPAHRAPRRAVRPRRVRAAQPGGNPVVAKQKFRFTLHTHVFVLKRASRRRDDGATLSACGDTAAAGGRPRARGRSDDDIGNAAAGPVGGAGRAADPPVGHPRRAEAGARRAAAAGSALPPAPGAGAAAGYATSREEVGPT